ncbi:FUSC family protein [Streptomyces sp. NPDC101171]|uniref:FUSC family protein n=1 Tax=Streptomyces sp. NPDC101171 TaxID=3366122 RepID=UPI003811E018
MAAIAAFGSFSMLLLVDYTGPMRQRIRAHVALTVVWAALISLGTLVAGVTWLAATVTVVVSFTILFSGVVSSVLAGTTTALLLGFVLPVSSPAPLTVLPSRLAGAGLAALATVLAISLLWPRPATDPLSAPAARVCRAVAAVLRAEARRLTGDPQAPTTEGYGALADMAASATDELRAAFDATPYRPTGLSCGSRAIVRLVDELTWLSAIMADRGHSPNDSPACDPDAHDPLRAAALVLDEAAALLDDPRASPDALQVARTNLRAALDGLEREASPRLPVHRRLSSEPEVRSFIEALDVSFRAQELAYAVLRIAGNVRLAAVAEQRSWLERLLGRDPGALGGPLTSARERAAAHLQPHSVWLHNSLRGALGLGVAVVLVHLTSLQNSFWVLLGTLSVLRSNALSTGQSTVRALAGTLVGSLFGAGLLQLIGHHGTVLWLLLPAAVLGAGIAPAVISFAAGQAAFTITLVVLFNIGQNPDWHIALVRLQDIAIGCAVSLLVGLFFWPRGAASAVDRALATAYQASARYLAAAVDYAVGRCGNRPVEMGAPLEQSRQAAAAARRLDDTLRSYLAERGSKHLPMADMATLVAAIATLRLAADAVLGLWRRAHASPQTDWTDARLALLGMSGRVTGWFMDLSIGLVGRDSIPQPLERNKDAEAAIAASVRRDLRDEHGHANDTALRIIWTVDHLHAISRMQPGLAAAAEARDGPGSPHIHSLIPASSRPRRSM